jgi:hypothetical protein
LHFTDSFADFVFWICRLVITWMWLLYRLCYVKLLYFGLFVWLLIIVFKQLFYFGVKPL